MRLGPGAGIGIGLALLLAGSAQGQQQQQPSAVDRAVMLALELQRIGASVQQVAVGMQGELAQAKARIAELEKLCGDRCASVPAPAGSSEPAGK